MSSRVLPSASSLRKASVRARSSSSERRSSSFSRALMASTRGRKARMRRSLEEPKNLRATAPNMPEFLSRPLRHCGACRGTNIARPEMTPNAFGMRHFSGEEKRALECPRSRTGEHGRDRRGWNPCQSARAAIGPFSGPCGPKTLLRLPIAADCASVRRFRRPLGRAANPKDISDDVRAPSPRHGPIGPGVAPTACSRPRRAP